MSLRADITLHHTLAGAVRSVAYAAVDPRPAESEQPPLACADLLRGPMAEADRSLNVVASGFANLVGQGASYFPDTNLGTAPPGTYILWLEGRSEAGGSGVRRAAGCASDVVVGAEGGRAAVQLDPI